MPEENKYTSIIKLEAGAIIRVNKTLEITNKLLATANKPALITYKSVIIGNQEWMVENLNVDHFKNGDLIPEAKTAQEWKEAGDKKQPAWCYYENNPKNGKIYGKLYNWYAVNDTRNICPKGWHVPSDAEWETLVTFLGSFSVAGGKLKESGFEHWDRPNKGANNISQFSALPAGLRGYDGEFNRIGDNGHWWCTTEDSTGCAWDWCMWSLYSVVSRLNLRKENGFSVRCLKH